MSIDLPTSISEKSIDENAGKKIKLSAKIFRLSVIDGIPNVPSRERKLVFYNKMTRKWLETGLRVTELLFYHDAIPKILSFYYLGRILYYLRYVIVQQYSRYNRLENTTKV